MPNIEAGAKKAGRNAKDIEICGLGFVITGKTEEDVEKAKAPVRQQLSFYASTRTYRPVLDIEGWGELNEELFGLSIEGKWQDMATRITDDMLQQFAVIGTHDQIIKKIKERSVGVIDRMTFAIPTRTPDDEAQLKEMIKELQAA
jgi:alkanesulfonate monooxygenase SsuD/methylene tetrahydromethanopterin reductase-like flavin-dependent oxidoreductase (luciferase family)